MFVATWLFETSFFKEVAVVDEVCGVSAESLFSESCSADREDGFRKAGCCSIGGALGGGTVTDIGGFPSIVSSYLNDLIPFSSRN